MNSLNFVLGAAASSSSASSYSGIILIILMVALMYFFMIRPQQKQRKEHQEMMSDLKPGDEVVTIGRMHGKIDSINKSDRTVTLDCEGIYLTFDLNAIYRVAKRANEENTAQATDKAAENTDSKATSESSEAASDEKAADTKNDEEK